MKKKSVIFSILGLFLLPTNGTIGETVASASETDVSKTLQTIKYTNFSNEISNL